MFFGPFLVAFGLMGAVPANGNEDAELLSKYVGWLGGGVTAGLLAKENKSKAKELLDQEKKPQSVVVTEGVAQ